LLESFKKLPRSVKHLILGIFLSQLAIGLLFIDASYFLTGVKKLPATFSGLFFSIEGVSSVLLSVPFGALSDRHGRKKFVIVGNTVIGLSVALISITNFEPLLLLSAFLSGAGDAAFTASTGALLAQHSTSENRVAVFSLASLTSDLTWGIGGFALLLVTPLTSFGISAERTHVLLYLSLGIFAICSNVALLKVGESKPSIRRTKLSKHTKHLLLRYTFSNSFFAFGAGMVVPLISEWFYYRYGVTDALSGPILGASNLAIALTTLIAPSLTKRFGLVKSIVLTEGLSTLFMFVTPLPSSFWVSGSVYIVRTYERRRSAFFSVDHGNHSRRRKRSSFWDELRALENAQRTKLVPRLCAYQSW
jgi:Major Facilitator Superfamily.